ncbi:amidohydrolase family protein [Hyunsoonleella sp. SJ7]|uniref:Amidohydrolase family protein n=1 Tax=Hyunsoonleella aquatilis TaxID=2762758 RepID=A0A923KL77_9FLAO|nr:amidohydrolase family protein [Hyunsoonleella aquatilis]MBC3758573.1 amidohydrolase family protein [Hyunsoonleella aquatilis]
MLKRRIILFLSLLAIQQITAQEFTDEVKRFIAIDTTVVAIKNVGLIDGKGTSILDGQTIVLKKDKIVAIGKGNNIEIPENALIIDGTNKTVIPGLVMLHEHLFYTKFFENWFSVGQMTFSFPRLYLAGGVTTMRTAGSIQPQSDLNVKQWIIEGKMTGPKMDVTSPFIEREGLPIAELGFIKDTKEVSEIVNFWANRGVTSFKLYNNITKEDMKVCIEEAHNRGMKVTGHLCSVTYEEASNLGIDNLEHGFMAASDFMDDKEENICDPFSARNSITDEPIDGEKINRLIDILIKNGTTITTTPNVFEPWTDREMIPGGGEKAVTPEVLKDVKEIYDGASGKDSLYLVRFNKNLAWLKRFYDKGGKLVAGTDPTGAGRTVAGYGNRRTIEILSEAGFPLVDVIKICTLNGATYLEQQDDIGTLEVGKTADLVLIDGDLRTDIKNIRNMEIVFKDGIGFDSKKLFESVHGKVGLN